MFEAGVGRRAGRGGGTPIAPIPKPSGLAWGSTPRDPRDADEGTWMVTTALRMRTHLSLTRILVPLDGSTLAEAVMPVAERLARDHDAEVVLLEVLEGRESRDAEI